MADLTDLQAAQSVKVVGTGLSGAETNPLAVDSFQSAQVGLYGPTGQPITDSSNGVAGNRLLHVQTPDTTAASATLGALNATISIPMAGLPGAGWQINAGTLIGTLVPESSLDGGTSWAQTYFIDPSTNSASSSFTFTAANTLKLLSVVPLNGASHVRVRVSSYTSGSATSILRASLSRGATQSIATTQIVSSLPAARVTKDVLINSGVTQYTAYTATQNLAFKQFYAAGTGIGQQRLFYYFPALTQYLTGGNFEVAGDVGTTWVWTSVGGTGSAAQSNVQAFTGTFSAAITFTNSSGNNAQGLKQTFSSPQDFSTWRYVTAQFFNTVSAGGAYTRTISIILTDSSGSTFKYDLTGSSTVAPFNASNWIKLTAELENPTSFTGTGFDITQISSIELRMADSANKSGTVYWDTVQFEAQLSLIIPIFHAANQSVNVAIDPVAVLTTGNQIVIAQANADTTRQEYFALAGGVAL
jgi:hypothetical protein